MNSPTPLSSQELADSTSASKEPDGAPSASPRSTPTPAPSSQSDGPESQTSAASMSPMERLHTNTRDTSASDLIDLKHATKRATGTGAGTPATEYYRDTVTNTLTEVPPGVLQPKALALRGREEGSQPELSDLVSSLRTSAGGSSQAMVLQPAQGLSENQRGELLLTDTMHQITAGGGKPGQGYPAVLIGATPPSGLEDSPAKTSPSPESDEAWGQKKNEREAASPMPSLTLFDSIDLPPSSSKMYRDSSPAMPGETLGLSSLRWASSGTGGPTGFSTLSSSECPSDDDGCSFAPSTLAQVLEPIAPQRFYLSARAATGILRRATRRGRLLPTALQTALEALAGSTRDILRTDAGKKPLSSTPPQSSESSSKTTSPETSALATTSPPTTSSVRRLTPVECERLMGWPDGWTISREWRTRSTPAATTEASEPNPAPILSPIGRQPASMPTPTPPSHG